MDLRIFEGKALAHALTKSGHSVSERTTQRWIKGETQPKPQDLAAIRALVGQTEEDSPPDWARSLESNMKAMYSLMRLAAVTGGVSQELVQEIEAARLDALGQSHGGQQPFAPHPTADPDPRGG